MAPDDARRFRRFELALLVVLVLAIVVGAALLVRLTAAPRQPAADPVQARQTLAMRRYLPLVVESPATPSEPTATQPAPTSAPTSEPAPATVPPPASTAAPTLGPARLGANLLLNPECAGRHNYIPDNWVSVPSADQWWTVSTKDGNPPFDEDATACRLAQTRTQQFTFDPAGLDAFLYQVVAADPAHKTLQFAGWWVSGQLTRFAVSVDGAESPDGPWTPVWVPFESAESTRMSWVELSPRAVTLDWGWPYYRFGLFCRYDGGVAGCKATLLHFGVGDGG